MKNRMSVVTTKYDAKIELEKEKKKSGILK